MENSKYYVTQIKMEDYLTINKTGKINLCPTYQRPPVKAWTKPPMQNAGLSTIFENLPFPPIHLRITDGELTDEEIKTGLIKFENLKLEALDGQQRTLFYLRVKADEVTPTDEDLSPEAQSIKNKLWSQWTDEEKSKYLQYPVNVYVYPELSDDQASELFARINSGNIKLTAKQSLRGLILPQLRALQEQINHASLSTFAVTDRETILIQVIESLTSEKPDYKDQKEMIKRFANSEIKDETKTKITAKLENLQKIITLTDEDDPNKIAVKRILKRIHVTGLIVSLPETELTELQKNNIIRFFNESGKDASENRKTYNLASTQDTASTSNILTRNRILITIIHEPVRATQIHAPAPTTDATTTKHQADAEHAKTQQQQAQALTDARIQANKAKQQAKADMQTDDTDMQQISKFKQRQAKQSPLPAGRQSDRR
jgi:hypothetical protein